MEIFKTTEEIRIALAYTAPNFFAVYFGPNKFMKASTFAQDSLEAKIA